MYALRFDGSFRSLPEKPVPSGFLGFGWLVYFQTVLIAYGYGIAARGKDATSNVAEYLALIEGLEAMIGMGITSQPVAVLSDANVIIHRMNGYATVGTFRDQPLHNQAVKLSQEVNIYDWRWVPRQCNYQADALSRKCFQELLGDRESLNQALLTLQRNREEEDDTLHYLDGLQIIKRDDLPAPTSQNGVTLLATYLTASSREMAAVT